MRTILLMSTVFWMLALCGRGLGGRQGARKKDAKMLEGTWQLVEGVMGGKTFPPRWPKGSR